MHFDNTPAPTKTWEPVSHGELIRTTKNLLAEQNFWLGPMHIECTDGKHPHTGETITDANMFAYGKLTSTGKEGQEDYTTQFGIRNSHCQRTAIGVVIGAQITVCSNMIFEGEEKVTQVHHPGSLQKFIDNLGAMLSNGWLDDRIMNQDRYISNLKRAYMSNTTYRIFTEALLTKAKVLPIGAYGQLVTMWKDYNLQAFPEHTAWRAHNIVTELLKRYPVGNRVKKIEAMDRLLGVKA